MAQAEKEQDQSMEDILQSIKRIIAEEGDPAPEVAGSDVLELTELLADDGSISKIQPTEEPVVPSVSLDEIMAQAEAPKPQEEVPVLHVKATEPEPLTLAEPEPEPEPEPTPEPEPAPAFDIGNREEALISDATLSASVAALHALRDSMAAPAAPKAATHFRSGTTVEDLVLESLKPMLKEWLDANLPQMVEALVAKEISKLSKF